MARTDLLSLSAEDLITLSNRGTVNAARKDLESGITGTLEISPDEALRIEWSDGRICELPPGKPLRSGRCSCNAVNVCKHLVRMVLLYQQQNAVSEETVSLQPWDPGTITDDELRRHLKTTTLTRAKKLYDAGIMAELIRGTRPVARFHLPVCIVRFLVPGDIQYTRCDCARPAPCEHVALAVWAFRQLDMERRAGLVTCGTHACVVPTTVLDDLEAVLVDLISQGISGAGQGWVDRLARQANLCRAAGLYWPADILEELTQEQQSYLAHDARFDPTRVAMLLGEQILRIDAIRNDTGNLPQTLIRGSEEDRPIELGTGQQFWGLGCGVRVRRRVVEMTCYFYDVKSGGVVTLFKEVPDADIDEKKSQRSFAAIGRRVAIAGRQGSNHGPTFHDLGAGILQLNHGRRSANYRLHPGRTDVAVSVHDRLLWEEIQPPVLVEEYWELDERLGSLPPSSLRPRRTGDDFHVLRVASFHDPRFDSAYQMIQARLTDRTEQSAFLEHPYTTRGRRGAESLLTRLTTRKGELLFVAGSVRRTPVGLVISPTALVWQEDGRRTIQQPWVDGEIDTGDETETTEKSDEHQDVVMDYVRQVQLEMGELLVLGLTRSDPLAARRWRELAQQGESVGFARLSGLIHRLAESLQAKSHTLRWETREAAKVLFKLLALGRLVRDVV